MSMRKWGVFKFHIIRHHHESLQIDDILNIVRKQCFKCFLSLFKVFHLNPHFDNNPIIANRIILQFQIKISKKDEIEED